MTSLVTRLIPFDDREAIVGDLLEEAAWRHMHGRRMSWWLAGQCATIAVGLSVDRARAACSVELMREVASGIAIDSEHMLHVMPRTLATRAGVFAAGVAVLAYGCEILVGALLRSAGL